MPTAKQMELTLTVSCRRRASDLSEDGDPWINASSHPGDAGELGGSGRTELLRAERLGQKQQQQQLHGAQSLGPLPGAHGRGHLLQRGALEPKRLRPRDWTSSVSWISALRTDNGWCIIKTAWKNHTHTPCICTCVCVCVSHL